MTVGERTERDLAAKVLSSVEFPYYQTLLSRAVVKAERDFAALLLAAHSTAAGHLPASQADNYPGHFLMAEQKHRKLLVAAGSVLLLVYDALNLKGPLRCTVCSQTHGVPQSASKVPACSWTLLAGLKAQHLVPVCRPFSWRVSPNIS